MRTLIVEDDFTSRLLLQTYLSRFGECHVAINGVEAVEAFRMSKKNGAGYDLICMDIMMPEMDGQTALRGEAAHHLGRTVLGGEPYYLRRLSHREDRIDLESMGAERPILEAIVDAEALALALAHARSRKRLGLPDLQAPSLPERDAWLVLAARLAGRVEADYLAFTL